MKKSTLFFAISVFVWALLAPQSLGGVGGALSAHAQTSACPSDISGYGDDKLAELLAICEKEIADQQQKLTLTQKQATTVASIITLLKGKIKNADLEIKSRNISIAKLAGEIVVRNQNITALNARMDRMKTSLAELMRQSHELADTSIVEAIFSADDISNFFVNLDDFQAVQGKLHDTLDAIEEAKAEKEVEKQGLETSKTKEAALKAEQEQLKKQTQSLQGEQERVLKLTQSQAKAYAADIADKQRVRTEIANRIFRTVGGTELRFEEALKLVRVYEGQIGVSPALVLAILTQESSVSGLIGKNIGKCTYNQSATNSAGTVMSPSQIPSFLAIMTELGLNADTTPVSCPIYSDGAYGGAMGPSQFMPSTWWNVATETGYKRRVAKVMGIATPNPFRSLDAFTGTALYMQDAQDRCKAAFTTTFEIRACSAAKYYAGLGATGTRLAGHMNPKSSYGYQVAARAAQFEKDIATLDQG